MKVYINDRNGRRLVDGEVVKRNPKTVWVRLSGGRIIKRKLRRDVP